MKTKRKKIIFLNREEDAAYDKGMSHYLNEGLTDLQAEKKTIADMKNQFPRLKKSMVGNYKISLTVKD